MCALAFASAQAGELQVLVRVPASPAEPTPRLWRPVIQPARSAMQPACSAVQPARLAVQLALPSFEATALLLLGAVSLMLVLLRGLRRLRLAELLARRRAVRH